MAGYGEEAEKKAMANLETVMKAVGARFAMTANPWGADVLSVEITLNGNLFVLIAGGIAHMSNFGGVIENTCFMLNGNMPHAEWIASALLLLHRDPALFWCWKKRDAWYA